MVIRRAYRSAASGVRRLIDEALKRLSVDTIASEPPPAARFDSRSADEAQPPLILSADQLRL